jgi:anti-sigma regulatory factor (Ser/Thr protein kinase)
MMASEVLAPVVESPADARAFVDRTLAAWGCQRLVDDVRLVVTELVSNGVTHAGTPIEVVLELDEGALRIMVTDASLEAAVLVHAGATAERGRGLVLVDRFSDRWGVEILGDHKTVWAEWALPS